MTTITSILFPRPGTTPDIEKLSAPDCFGDLHLDQVITAVTTGHTDDGPKTFFYAPLHDVSTVSYRHDVFRDLERDEIRQPIENLVTDMRTMRQRALIRPRTSTIRCSSRAGSATPSKLIAAQWQRYETFRTNVRDGVFTHFKREEDATMTHGKLDEELARMSEMFEFIGSGSLLLCNESFASTNEREGSEIARGVVRAMIESGVKVVFVTHLYDLAHSLHACHDPGDLFLRAERRPDGARTFRLIPGEPETTSYGEDSFRRVFGLPAHAD